MFGLKHLMLQMNIETIISIVFSRTFAVIFYLSSTEGTA